MQRTSLYRRVICLAMLCCLIGWGSSLFAATTSGNLVADETWSGTVSLTGDVTVPAELTLTIEPGTQIIFPALSDDTAGGQHTGLSELIVYGSLVAAGTSDAPIRFTSDAAVKAKGDWGGVLISWGSGDKALQLEFGEIEYAARGIVWQASAGRHSGTIADSLVRYTGGDGIYVYNYNGGRITADLTANTVSNNDGRGVHLDTRGPSSQLTGSVTDNTIAGNGGNGLYVYIYDRAVADLAIEGNLIQNNSGYGIYLNGNSASAATSRFEIRANTVHDSGVGIYSYKYSSDMTVEITGNAVFNST